MATAIRIAHAIAIRFGEPSMSFGFGHRFGSKSIADRSIRIELLIDCEEDRTLRAVLVGMLREAERGR